MFWNLEEKNVVRISWGIIELNDKEPREIVKIKNIKEKEAPKEGMITNRQVSFLLFLWNQKSKKKTVESLMVFTHNITHRLLISPNMMTKDEGAKMIKVLQRGNWK